jgi:hypothetical protein
MRRLFPILAIAVLLASCEGSSSGEAPSPVRSGIHGTVTAGPQCPVVQEASPCPDAPWEGSVHITGDGVDIEVATYEPGRFRVALDAGTYEVTPVVAGPGSVRPVSVQVPGQGFVEVVLTVDTGIR